ncbi:hypothetical protein Tco_0880002 [Tanacetum coccineum]
MALLTIKCFKWCNLDAGVFEDDMKCLCLAEFPKLPKATAKISRTNRITNNVILCPFEVMRLIGLVGAHNVFTTISLSVTDDVLE